MSRLPSIFDRLPPGADADAIELAMAEDQEARTLAALDRALAGPPGGPPPDPPAGFAWNPDQPRNASGEFAPVEGAGTGANPNTTSGPLPDSAVNPLPRAEAALRTGLSEGQLAGFRRVLSVDEFVKNPPAGLAGAILLGKTRNQPHNLYWHLAATHGMQPWTKTYPQSLGPRYRDHLDDPACTRKFMDGLFARPSLADKPIVFLCPTNVLTPGAGRYTRQEMEYLLASPERARRVVLVAGTDDYIDPAAVAATGGTARQRFDRVRATLDARRKAPAASRPLAPETNPAEFADLALFEWDAAKHPHGEHGWWAAVGRAEAGAQAAADAAGLPTIHGLADGATAGLDRVTAKWAAGLDPYEKGVVEFYTGSLYKQINAALRDHPDLSGLGEGTLTNALALDRAIRKYPEHAAPVTSYRGVKRSTPDKESQTRAALDAALATGATVTFDGFTSASLDPFVALQWGQIALEIKSRRGAYLGAASERAGEKEMLFTHGERFRVVGVADRKYRAKNGGELVQRTYTLETVDDPPPPLPRPPAAFFDPGEARDGHGRWTEGASGPASLPAGVRWAGPLKDYRAACEAYLGTLGDEERASVKTYTGSKYYHVNTIMRGESEASRLLGRRPKDTELAQRVAAGLTSFFAKAPVSPFPVTSYRGVRSRTPGKLAQIEEGFQAALATGAVVGLTGFSSASMDPAVAAVWTLPAGGFVLEMKSRRGVYVAPLADSRHEEEVLHNHGAKFRVTGVRTVAYQMPDRSSGEPAAPRSVRTYTLEEVEPAGFAFDPARHPHGEHGRWAATGGRGGGSDLAPPEAVTEVIESPDLSEFLGSPTGFAAVCNRWADSLSEAQKGAVKDYAGSNFRKFNEPLRNGTPFSKPEFERMAKAIQEALASAPVHAEAVTSYRGLRSRSPEKLAELRRAFQAAYETGSPVTVAGFNSASLDPHTAAEWTPAHGCVLEIKSRRAPYIDRLAPLGGEHEVLHNHNTTYKVTGVRRVEYRQASGGYPLTRTTFTLEEVGPPTPAHFFDPAEARDPHGKWAKVESAERTAQARAGTPAAGPDRLEPLDDAAFLAGPLADLARRASHWAGRLDKAELGAFKAYTGVNYKTINKSLRAHPDPDDPAHSANVAKWVKRISQALDSFIPMPQPVTSYRGLKTSSRAKLRQIEASLLRARDSGDPITVHGFQSASLDPAFAARWAMESGREAGAVLEVKSRRGVYVSSLSRSAGEYEVLHNHGATYRVTGVRPVRYTTRLGCSDTCVLPTYTLEEVEPPRPGRKPAAFYDEHETRDAHGRWTADAPLIVIDPYTGEARPRKVGLEDFWAMEALDAAREVLPAAPHTDEEIKRVADFYTRAGRVAEGWVAESGHRLDDDQRRRYATSLRYCFTHMTPQAIQAVFDHLGSANPQFFPDPESLTADINADRPAHKQHDGLIAGCWSWSPFDTGGLGTLRLDGGGDTDRRIADDTPGVHAHELGHAIDGHNSYSNRAEWKKAWAEEIDAEGNPLSAYARTDPHEGFAEFHRLLVTQVGVARRMFPQCYAFWKKQGLA